MSETAKEQDMKARWTAPKPFQGEVYISEHAREICDDRGELDEFEIYEGIKCLRSAEAAAREEEWKAIRGGLNMAKSHERNDKAVIHNGAIGLALQIVNAREDIVRNALAGEEGEG